MIHLPFGARARQRQALLAGLPDRGEVKKLSQAEAQEVVDAATAILDGLQVLLVLAEQGNREAAGALGKWSRVLDRVREFRGV